MLRAIQDACGCGSRLERFRRCGQRAVVQRSVTDPAKLRIRCDRCGDRFCVPCQRVRAHRLAGRVTARMKLERHRFITLSLKSAAVPLVAQIARLNTAFAALRKAPLWQRTQRGGVAFLEVTLNEETGLWHPHLHVLVEGKFVAQASLSAAWLTVTGDSPVVHIAAVRDVAGVVDYVVRYVTKPLGKTLPRAAEALAEFIGASRGRRFVTTFGTWRGNALVREDPGDDAWADVAPLAALFQWAADGMPEAIDLVRELDRWLFPADLDRPPPLSRPPIPLVAAQRALSDDFG